MGRFWTNLVGLPAVVGESGELFVLGSPRCAHWEGLRYTFLCFIIRGKFGFSEIKIVCLKKEARARIPTENQNCVWVFARFAARVAGVCLVWGGTW